MPSQRDMEELKKWGETGELPRENRAMVLKGLEDTPLYPEAKQLVDALNALEDRLEKCSVCGRSIDRYAVHDDCPGAPVNTEHVNDLKFIDCVVQQELPPGHTAPGPEHDFSHLPPFDDPLPDEMNPKDRVGLMRVPLHLLPTAGKIAQAKAHLDGAEKYGVNNWREHPIDLMSYLGAIERHIERLKSGQDLDDMSDVPHLGHIMATCAIILDAQEARTLIDTRDAVNGDLRPKVDESHLLNRANEWLEKRTPNVRVSAQGIGRIPSPPDIEVQET